MKNKTVWTRKCPSCQREIKYTNIHYFDKANKLNLSCRYCSNSKNGKISDELSVKCQCGKITTYSTKYNANSARQRGRCSSCAATEANHERWKDDNFRKKMDEVRADNWKKYWSNPENKEKMSKRTSERNKERWKDEAYRNFMYDKIRLNSIRGVFGSYKGHHFRSSLELYYMIEILEKQNIEWESCENDRYCIEYDYESKTHWYYPDFRVGRKIIEIKPKYLWDNPIVLAKAEAAQKWCIEHGFEYELLDPGYYTKQQVIEMHKTGVIKLQSRKLIEAIS